MLEERSTVSSPEFMTPPASKYYEVRWAGRCGWGGEGSAEEARIGMQNRGGRGAIRDEDG